MPAFQALWTACLNHPALALNSLALFYAFAGSWLCVATQLRTARASARMATSADTQVAAELPDTTRRANRMFYSVAGACLALALLLSAVSTRF